MFTPERSIFSILGQAFGIYGKNIKYLAVITLIAFVPVFIFRLFIPQAYFEAFQALFQYTWSLYALNNNTVPEIMAMIPAAVFADAGSYLMIALGIELVFFPLSVAAATYLVFKHLKNEEPTFGGMFTAAMPIMPKMMVTSAIAVFIIYILFIFTTGGFFGGLLMILTLYIAVGMMFYQHIVADVGRWGFNAISLSRFIIRGRWFRVFFGSIVIFAAYFLIAWLTDTLGLALGLGNNVFLHLPFFLLQNFVLSYFAIVFAIWYFDIKRFHELNFKEVEKEIMERMKQHMDRFGGNTDKEEKEAEENEEE